MGSGLTRCTRWTFFEKPAQQVKFLDKNFNFFEILILKGERYNISPTKKAKYFRIWLDVAGTGLEPVTFGL